MGLLPNLMPHTVLSSPFVRTLQSVNHPTGKPIDLIKG